MDGGPWTCPHCGASALPGQRFCGYCGTALLALGGGSAEPEPTDLGYDPVAEADALRRAPVPSTPHTHTGLLLMIIGFAIGWIPYVSIVAGIVIIVGLVFLWMGRGEFGGAHWRDVHVGMACILLAFLLEVGAAVVFVGAVVSAANTAGETVQQIGATFRSDLTALFVVTLVATTLGALGYLWLPYSLTDRTSRLLLWTALVADVAISVAVVAIMLPEISSAISTATSGSSVNTGPILALQTRATLLGALGFVPYMMFFAAYYRVRKRLVAGTPPAPPRPAPVAPYGRIG